jgi:polar amino acid transport system substrate-binding protein
MAERGRSADQTSKVEETMTKTTERRDFLKIGALGLAGGALLAGATAVPLARQAAAAADPNSKLRAVLDRGHLIVGTGSTNAPWHFEDEKGNLVGMDIAMGQILAKGLFADPTKIEFVQQDPAARIPNINTGKVDITIQFMTISSDRAQLVNFSRPYYVEGVALLTLPGADGKKYDQIKAAGANGRVSILQNVGAEEGVHEVLPDATVMQLDTQANVIQALESHRVDAAAVDLSTVRWMVARAPDKYADAGKTWRSMLYGAALPQGDLDWLTYVNQVFDCAMFGHENEIFDKAFKDYFGETPPTRKTGFPAI